MTDNRLPVSVCMATYNGRKFIKEQIESILSQLDNIDDEIIIFDDESKDDTVEVIKTYNNVKIKFYQNEQNIGYIKTFEKAIEKAKNPLIFLSDQDDIWIDGRLRRMYDVLINDKANLLLCSNFQTFTESGEEISRFKTRLAHFTPERFYKNILGIFRGNMAYFGCTMAFKSEFKHYLLPFPKYIDAHDLWIAILGNILGKVIHFEDNTLMHRIHGSNTSFVNRSLKKKIFTRFLFFKCLLEAKRRKE